MKFEYHLIPLPVELTVTTILNHLNKLGSDDWELVTIFNGVAYFKRAMPINIEQGGSAKFSYETCENGYVFYDKYNDKIEPWELLKILNMTESIRRMMK